MRAASVCSRASVTGAVVFTGAQQQTAPPVVEGLDNLAHTGGSVSQQDRAVVIAVVQVARGWHMHVGGAVALQQRPLTPVRPRCRALVYPPLRAVAASFGLGAPVHVALVQRVSVVMHPV